MRAVVTERDSHDPETVLPGLPGPCILQFELWQQPGLVAGVALILLALPWGRQLADNCCRYRT
jgi:hypothetical protein